MAIVNTLFRHSFKLEGKEIDSNFDHIRNLVPFMNVKELGAVGDGFTDDAAAIQRGLSAINTNGGGTLYFPAGTYLIGTTLVIYSNTTMLGESYGAVTLKSSSTFSDRLLQNQARLGSGTDSEIQVQNIIFDMSGRDTPPTFARVDDLLFYRCAFINGNTTLFLLTGSTYDDNHHDYFVECLFDSSNLTVGLTDITNFGNGEDIQIIRCTFVGGFTASGNVQISAAGMTNFTVRDCWFDGQGNASPLGILGINGGGIYDCEIFNSKEFGIKISRFTEGTPDSEMTNFNVRGNRIYGNDTYGIWVRQESAAADIVYRLNISNNWIYNNDREGILCEVADGLHITHNFIYNNSKASAGTYYACNFNQVGSTAASLKNIIVDYNRFFDDQGTPTQTSLFNLNYVTNFHSVGNDISNITTKYTTANTTNPIVFDDGDARIFAGTFTRTLSTASGSVAYTGVGFRPRSVIFIGAKDATSQSGFGFADGTNNNALALLTAVTWSVLTGTACAALIDAAGTSQIATLSSLDADGFTLSWTKAGSPTGTGTFYYLALK